jgi:hypothetical protein
MSRGVSRLKQYNHSYPVDFGYIIIPTDVSRSSYVSMCYKRERITILGNGGMGIIRNCYISREILREIDFPKNNATLGQMVAYIVNSYNNVPMIIGVISKEGESQLMDEGEFRLEKFFNKNEVSISGRAKSANLMIDVVNGAGKGDLVVNISGSEEGSSLVINVKGTATIYTDDEINLNTVGTVNIKSIDQTDETKFSLVKVTNTEISAIPVEGGRFVVSTGGEPMVLGNKNSDILSDIQSLLNDLNTALSTFTTATSTAAVEPTLAPASISLQTSLQGMVTTISGLVSKIDVNNSEISFTD